MSEVAVLGAGSWGTAIASVLADNGHRTRLWGRDSTHIEALRSTGRNEKYLPAIDLPPGIEPCVDQASALEGADLVVVAVPSHAFPGLLDDLRGCANRMDRLEEAGLIWVTKGFDPTDHSFLHEVARKKLGERVELGVVSGPSFAREVAQHLPTAVTLAAASSAFAQRAVAFFHASSFRVYTTDDLIGVQVGGGLKNVLAIAAGVLDGLGFGANARAALVTRGLAELTRLGLVMGGRAETLAGLAGMGDLILTCSDDQSRNRRFGLALAAGHSRQEAERSIGQVVEGIGACRSAHALGRKYGVELPICEHVYDVLFNGTEPRAAVTSLLSREPRAESA